MTKRGMEWFAAGLACALTGVALFAGQAHSGVSRPEEQLLPTCNRGAEGAVPAFVRFAWLSPPNAVTDSASIGEMAEAGFNILLPAYNDEGLLPDNLRRLDLAAANGLRCLIADERFLGVDLGVPAGRARVDSIVSDYVAHPGLLGWYLGDEPMPPWNALPALHGYLHDVDPTHVVYNNLHGRQRFQSEGEWRTYTLDFLQSCCSMVLSNDQYDFLLTSDRHQFTVNAGGSYAMAAYRLVPWWAVIQLIEHSRINGPHGFRALEDGELRWQVGHALAHGARGIGYFSYWTPDPDTFWTWATGSSDATTRARTGSRS